MMKIPILNYAALAAAGMLWQPAATRAQVPPARQYPVITEIRSPSQLTPEVRQKVEDALPKKAYAKPKKPRKLLVMDRQVNYPGHRSIPHANLAVELMGKKLGTWEATFSNELSNMQWDKLHTDR